MALSSKEQVHYEALTRGFEGRPLTNYVNSPAGGMGGGFATYRSGRLLKQTTYPVIGNGLPYTAAQWTETKTGVAAAIAQATTEGGGILSTAGSTSTFNTNHESIFGFTPTVDRRWGFMIDLQVSSLTAVGFSVGFGNSQVDPATTDYTDGVYFQKAAATATVTGRVRGDSGTVAATGTLGTLVANTRVQLGFFVDLQATAATCSGYWVYDAGTAPVITAFTANQLTQLVAILTTPPTMFLNLNTKGSAGNPTVTYTAAAAFTGNAF